KEMPDLTYLWLSIFVKVFCGIEWVSSRRSCEWVGRVILSQSLANRKIYIDPDSFVGTQVNIC
ncbi:MAG: hypothetical protein U9Q37_06220, partial [Euryarchaeota archaeon]|nr:hypothetical protein [Euryarchaeota archaeon]